MAGSSQFDNPLRDVLEQLAETHEEGKPRRADLRVCVRSVSQPPQAGDARAGHGYCAGRWVQPEGTQGMVEVVRGRRQTLSASELVVAGRAGTVSSAGQGRQLLQICHVAWIAGV